MKKILHYLFITFLALVGFSLSAIAQTPDFATQPLAVGGSGNTVPYYYGSNGTRAQNLYPASVFSSMGPDQVYITKIYMIPKTAGPFTYNNFEISLGQPNITSLATNAYAGPVTRVLTKTNFTINRVVDEWLGIELDDPFLFDPTLPLLVEINLSNATATSWTTQYNNPHIPGTFRNYSTSYNASAPTSGSQTLVNKLGFDFIPSTPCTSPPFGGTTLASASIVCANQPFELSLSANSSGSGQTYQWESSTDNINWTPITNATQTTLTTSVTTNTTFRCALTCGGLTSYSSDILITIRGALNAGIYTINPFAPTGGNNFNSITEAIAVLNSCGIAGPVVFDMEPNTGPFNEKINLGFIDGSSSTNTITFNGNGVTLHDTITATETNTRYIVELNGAKYVTIQNFNFVIDTPSSTQGFNIHLTGGAAFNTIRNNTLFNSITSTSTSFAGIALSGAVSSVPTTGGVFTNNIIEDNIITGGYYGIVMAGSTGGVSKGNVIAGNKIFDTYQSGIYITGCDSNLVTRNEVSRPTRTNSTTFYGVYVLANSYRTIVERNIIHNVFQSIPTSTSAFYGVYVSGTDTKIGDFTIKNNLIYGIRSNGSQYGLINNGSDSVQYFNNTIVFDDPNPSTTVVNGFLQTTTACLGVQLMNNIFYITRPGSANRIGEYWTTATSTYTSDYNNFYIIGGSGTNAIAFHSSNYTSLPNWQLTGKDTHSLDVDPMFLDTANADFLFDNFALNGAGINLPNVTDDILGNPRVGDTDIGAFEMPSRNDDAGISSILSPLEPVTAGSQPIKVRIRNYGINDITALTVNWAVNGVPGPVFLYMDTLASFNYIDTVIATPVFAAGPNEIMVWTSNPNNTSDSYIYNDTSLTFLYFCSPFNGTYTIDENAPLSVTNFHSLSSFTQKLQECGVSGPVDVLIADGTYQEQIVVNKIPGVSEINTVHFTSQSGDSSLVTITYPSGSSATGNYVIRLSKVKHVSFSKLGFNRSGTLGYANVFELADSSSNITFTNNSFTGPVYTTVSTDGRYSAIYSQQASTHDSIVVKNNYFKDNGNAVWIYNSAPIATKGTGFVAENNRADIFYIGIFVSNQHAPVITNNVVTRNNLTSTTEFIGLGTNYISGPAVYTNNKVFAREGHFGLRLRGNVSTASNEILIANNFFQTGGTGTSRGISLQDSFKYINIAHNSILTSGTNTTNSRSIAVTGANATSGSNINIYNNILVNTGGGYALYVQASDTNAVTNSDYNDLYATGTNVGFWGANATGLSAFQALSKKDSNSVSVDPFFVSDTDLHVISAVLNNGALPLSYVTTDIDGETRSITTPDIGADEFTPEANNIAVQSILYPSIEQLDCGNVNDSVIVAVRNYGSEPAFGFTVNAEITGDINASFNAVVSDTLEQGDVRNVVIKYYNSKTTGANTSMDLKVYTSLIGDADHSNDTLVQTTILNPSPASPSIVSVGQACVGGSATITASSPASLINWYDVPVGGTAINEGPTFNTPTLNTNTTYYVEASNSTVGYTNVGPQSPADVGAGGGTAAAITTYYMEFSVANDLTLESVDIFPTATVGSSGTITVQTTTGQTIGSVPYTTTVTGGATPQTIVLNMNLTPGTYRMGQLAPAINLYRNTAGAVYPYTNAGLSILSNNFNAVYYYYFYNWKVKVGVPGCASERIPVNVTVQPRPSGSVINQGSVFNGVYNAGTFAQPDEVCVGDTLSYLVTAPTGFDLAGYGTTWTLTDVSLKRMSGNAVAGQFSNTNNNWSYVSALGDADSILRFTAKVRNIATGCDSVIERYVRIRSSIVVDLGEDLSICQGNTVQLSAPLANSYLWSTGATTRTIIVSTSGTYSVTVTNAIGCSSSDEITVTVVPLPAVNLGADLTVCAGTPVTLDAGNPGATYLWSTGATTQTIQVTSSGIYAVQVTSATSGCIGRDTILVVVNASPNVNLGVDRTICPGDSTELDAGNPGSTYLWSTGETTRKIWAKDTGSYSVLVTNALNCSSSDILQVNYKDYPDASFSVNIPDTNALLVQFASLVQVSGQVYSWNFGDPASGAANTSASSEPSHTFSASGTYSVRLTITNTITGCKTTEIKEVTVKSVGIATDFVKIFGMHAAPNPFVGNTKIKYTLPENANDVSITVYDVLGRKIKDIVSNESQMAGSYEFDFENTDVDNASGVYIISLNVDGRTANIRVIDIAKQ